MICDKRKLRWKKVNIGSDDGEERGKEEEQSWRQSEAFFMFYVNFHTTLFSSLSVCLRIFIRFMHSMSEGHFSFHVKMKEKKKH